MNKLYKTALETNPNLWIEIPKEELTEELLLIALNHCTIFLQEDLMSLGDLGKSKRVLDTWVHRNEVLALDEVKWVLDEYPDYPKDVLMSKIEVGIDSMEFLGYTPYQILCMEEHFEEWNEVLVPLITEEQQIEIALELDYRILQYCSTRVGIEVLKECNKDYIKMVLFSIPSDARTSDVFKLAFKRSPLLVISAKEHILNIEIAKAVIEEGDFSEENDKTRTEIMGKLISFMDEEHIRIAFEKGLLTKQFLKTNEPITKIIAEFDAKIAVEYLPSTEWNSDAKELANQKKAELVKELIKDYDECRGDDEDFRWILEHFVENYKLYI